MSYLPIYFKAPTPYSPTMLRSSKHFCCHVREYKQIKCHFHFAFWKQTLPSSEFLEKNICQKQ